MLSKFKTYLDFKVKKKYEALKEFGYYRINFRKLTVISVRVQFNDSGRMHLDSQLCSGISVKMSPQFSSYLINLSDSIIPVQYLNTQKDTISKYTSYTVYV